MNMLIKKKCSSKPKLQSKWPAIMLKLLLKILYAWYKVLIKYFNLINFTFLKYWDLRDRYPQRSDHIENSFNPALASFVCSSVRSLYILFVRLKTEFHIATFFLGDGSEKIAGHIHINLKIKASEHHDFKLLQSLLQAFPNHVQHLSFQDHYFLKKSSRSTTGIWHNT